MNQLAWAVPREALAPGNRAIDRLSDHVKGGAAAELMARLANSADAKALGIESVRRAINDFYDARALLGRRVERDLICKGQIAWSDTTLAQHQRKEANAFLARSTGILEPMQRPLHLIDFGAGDGRMTEAALDGLSRAGAVVASVQLIDQNTRALARARTWLSAQRSALQWRITPGDFRAVIPQVPVQGTTLALASAAFHELEADERRMMLRRLSGAVRGLVIVELSQDNDGADLASGQHVLQVAQFYDRLIGDAYASLRRDQLWPVVGAFLLGELIQLLSSDYVDRGNFHLPTAGWADTLRHEGFQVVSQHESSLGGLTTAYLLAMPTSC